MKAIIQRVSNANVKVDNEIKGSINDGFLILLGVEENDDKKQAEILANKISGLRIFKDDKDKMNLSLLDINGEVLVISNFTLCADCSHGKRPSFFSAAKPDVANELYLYFCSCLRLAGVCKVETGVFGADMKVSLLNDGPITISLDSKLLKGGNNNA